VSWLAKIRDTAILGAVVATGLVAGLVLTACSTRARKDPSPLPVPSNASETKASADASRGPPDADRTIVADAAAGRPDARRVRREQPLPRNYVE
jgi:hypothetical protein